MTTRSQLLSIIIVLLAMHGVHRAQASKKICNKSPPSLSSSKVNHCKHLIVGGGPGGLFSAYMLRHMGSDLCILDRAGPVFGATTRPLNGQPAGAGRMLDFPGPNGTDAVMGTCGLRVNEAQKDLRCLFSSLNITLEESNFDTIISARGLWGRGSVNAFLPSGTTSDGLFNLKAADPEVTDLESALYEFALVVSTDINPLTGHVVSPHPSTKCELYSQVRQYLFDAIGEEATAFLMAGNSFKADFESTLDVCQYMEYFKADWKRCCTNFYPVGGWSALYLKISAILRDHGVRFFRKSEVTCMYEVAAGAQTKYVATTAKAREVWSADRMIINAGPVDMASMAGPLGTQLARDPHMMGIKPISIALYNAFYPERFWQPFMATSGQNFRVINDGFCTIRSEFPGHPYVAALNASRPIYIDDPVCVAMWRALYEEGGIEAVREQVRSNMGMMLGVTIPEPLSDIFYTRDNAWHYVQPFRTEKNITIADVGAWATHPLGKPGLCFVGEPYNLTGSGWAHGAWEAMVTCMRANFMDVMTKEAVAELDYLESGCNGATEFPTEVFSSHQEYANPILPGQQVPIIPSAAVGLQGDILISLGRSQAVPARFRP